MMFVVSYIRWYGIGCLRVMVIMIRYIKGFLRVYGMTEKYGIYIHLMG